MRDWMVNDFDFPNKPPGKIGIPHENPMLRVFLESGNGGDWRIEIIREGVRSTTEFVTSRGRSPHTLRAMSYGLRVLDEPSGAGLLKDGESTIHNGWRISDESRKIVRLGLIGRDLTATIEQPETQEVSRSTNSVTITIDEAQARFFKRVIDAMNADNEENPIS